MTFKNPIFKHTLIFFAYFISASSILFKKGEEAGVYFAVTIGVAIFVHLITLMVLVLRSVLKKDKKPPFSALFTVILLANIFILTSSYYLEFMWWLTRKF